MEFETLDCNINVVIIFLISILLLWLFAVNLVNCITYERPKTELQSMRAHLKKLIYDCINTVMKTKDQIIIPEFLKLENVKPTLWFIVTLKKKK